MIKFSVIIAVRKISDFLIESIGYLKKSDYPNFEVIIITDFPEIYDFGGDSRFILSDSKGDSNPGLKRNIAASMATGEILVFLDDDAYPTPNWLHEAAKIFDDPNIYALGGPAITPLGVGFLEQVSGFILKSPLVSGGTAYRHTPSPEQLIDDYPTVNLFVQKNAFEAVSGFGLEFWPGEDTKLCLDLVKKFGRKFNYSPLPIVYHHRRKVFAPHLKQISRYGRHRGQYARIFPETSRLLSYFIPSLFVAGLIGGLFTYWVYKPLFYLYLVILGIYIVLVKYTSIRAAVEAKNPLMFFYVALGIILTHIIYGVNFVYGFISRPRFKPKAVDLTSGNYSEG